MGTNTITSKKLRLGTKFQLSFSVEATIKRLTIELQRNGSIWDYSGDNPNSRGDVQARVRLVVTMNGAVVDYKGGDWSAKPADMPTKPGWYDWVLTSPVNTRDYGKSTLVFTIMRTDISGGDFWEETIEVYNYRTIQEVLDDPIAVRRQAILAQVNQFFPAFNYFSPEVTVTVKDGKKKTTIHAVKGLKVGDPSPYWGETWRERYQFDAASNATSCTTVNPLIMKNTGKSLDAKTGANLKFKWAYDAGPEGARYDKTTPNPGWIYCDKDHLPNVGDTYIVINQLRSGNYGHVGIVLHVPADGNGVWVCADGGAGSAAQGMQTAVIGAKWGLMGVNLPDGGTQKYPYKGLTKDVNGGPWIGHEVDESAPLPTDDNDISGIITRMVFKPSPPDKNNKPNPARPSAPRMIKGFVDVDSPNITFPDIDGKPSSEAIMKDCKELKTRVDTIIQKFRQGKSSKQP